VKVATDFCRVFDLRSTESGFGSQGFAPTMVKIGRGGHRCYDRQNQVLDGGVDPRYESLARTYRIDWAATWTLGGSRFSGRPSNFHSRANLDEPTSCLVPPDGLYRSILYWNDTSSKRFLRFISLVNVPWTLTARHQRVHLDLVEPMSAGHLKWRIRAVCPRVFVDGR
jgi:hypothetical protein